MQNIHGLEALFEHHGFGDYKWFDPKEIVVSQWVRMKCYFGCPEFGKTATCPPNVPTLSECRDFFLEYSQAVIFHFEKEVKKPEDRHAWTRKINMRLLKLEREVFLSGFQKAFLLFMDSCTLCSPCSGKRDICRYPKQARPAPEAMGVDVFSTVRKVGYPIEVLSDYSQKMNRYSFLMIE